MSGRWRRRFRSIRSRILLGYVLLLAITLGLTLLIARSALIARVENDVDRDLAAEVEQLERTVDQGDPDTGEPYTGAEALFDTHLRRVLPGDDAAFYTMVDGAPFLLSFDAPTDLLADTDLVREWGAVPRSTFDDVDSPAGRVRVLIVPVALEDDVGTFVAAAFTSGQRRDLDAVFGVLAAISGVVVLMSAVAAWTIANRVVRPVRELTDLATSITETDLSARIPVDGDDEVAELSTTFNAMMNRLEDGFTTQREFLDDVAHELRTPITIIQGHLDVLGDDPDERRETIDTLNDELGRMNRYVDDLLVLAQAEQPDFVRPQAVDLRRFGDSLPHKLTGLADRRWTVEAPEHGHALFDEQRITQAVLNLAQNAARHTSPGDSIDVSIVAGDDEVTIAVSDTGPGVEPAIMDGLFDRHIRSARSRSGGGVGIGLSIVDAIVQAHHGRVTVESTQRTGPESDSGPASETGPELRPGSTFTLTVPRQGPSEEDARR